MTLSVQCVQARTIIDRNLDMESDVPGEQGDNVIAAEVDYVFLNDHLESCPHCIAYRRDMARLIRSLDYWGSRTPVKRSMPEHLHQQIMAALPSGTRGHRKVSFKKRFAAIAAVGLLMLAATPLLRDGITGFNQGRLAGVEPPKYSPGLLEPINATPKYLPVSSSVSYVAVDEVYVSEPGTTSDPMSLLVGF